jgi:hypothetical protein
MMVAAQHVSMMRAAIAAKVRAPAASIWPDYAGLFLDNAAHRCAKAALLAAYCMERMAGAGKSDLAIAKPQGRAW